MSFSETAAPLREPSVRSRARDASRRKLLDAAAVVFARSGYTAAKAAEIAGEAGVAVGTLYHHFGDKEGIARAVAFEALEDLRGRLRRAAMRPGLVAHEAARAHAKALVAFASSAEARGRLLFAADSPGLKGAVLDAMAEAQEAHLRERAREGFFRDDLDPAVTAQALVGMQSRVLTWWIEDRSRASAATIVDTLAKIRLSGIHAQPAEARSGRSPRTIRKSRAAAPAPTERKP